MNEFWRELTFELLLRVCSSCFVCVRYAHQQILQDVLTSGRQPTGDGLTCSCSNGRNLAAHSPSRPLTPRPLSNRSPCPHQYCLPTLTSTPVALVWAHPHTPPPHTLQAPTLPSSAPTRPAPTMTLRQQSRQLPRGMPTVRTLTHEYPTASVPLESAALLCHWL